MNTWREGRSNLKFLQNGTCRERTDLVWGSRNEIHRDTRVDLTWLARNVAHGGKEIDPTWDLYWMVHKKSQEIHGMMHAEREKGMLAWDLLNDTCWEMETNPTWELHGVIHAERGEICWMMPIDREEHVGLIFVEWYMQSDTRINLSNQIANWVKKVEP